MTTSSHSVNVKRKWTLEKEILLSRLNSERKFRLCRMRPPGLQAVKKRRARITRVGLARLPAALINILGGLHRNQSGSRGVRTLDPPESRLAG